ncbi:MAG: cytidine deaminase [Prevotella sp.]|nr:cytidine deaminase [Prevotella sp.]MBR7042595.1 cytidine deaminase [Prevotella sp.]MBR7086443.1 cytidine deaminase [Prevotella sp.]
MENIRIEINMQFCQMDELQAADQELVKAAIGALANSYARYSNFNVGAALRLANGDIVIGANQENAAFPSGLCAERSAIFAAQSQQPDQPITTLAVAARNSEGLMDDPVSPCGGCRQVILEIEDRYKQPVRILLYGTRGIYCINSIKDLMPLSFVDENMR